MIGEAALTAAAAWTDITDRRDVDAVLAHAQTTIRTELDQALADAAAQDATDDTLALLARLTMETTAAEYWQSALALLARSETADAEAHQASAATMRSAHRYATRAAAKKAAAEAAQQARERTARHLLATRTAELLADKPAELADAASAPGDAKPDPYASGAARARAAMRAAGYDNGGHAVMSEGR
jgi:hypothetical protein